MRNRKLLHYAIAISSLMVGTGVSASEGDLDPTFAGTGSTIVQILSGTTPSGAATSVAVDADGKIILAGTASVPAVGSTLGIVRLLDDGTFDANFGNLSGQPGRSAFDLTPTFTFFYTAGFAQKGGAGTTAYYLGATSYISPNYVGLVLRVDDSGQLDSTFGGAGYALLDLSGGGTAHSIFARGVSALPDGSVVVGGEDYGVTGTPIYFAHVLATGVQDSNFGSNGILHVASPAGTQSVRIVDMKTDTEGNVLAALSYVTTSNGSKMALIRVSSAGVLDSSFAASATFAVVNFGLTGTFGDTVDHVAIEDDGKYVLVGAGTSSTPPNARCAVARFNHDGTPDTTFSGVGYQTFAIGSCNDVAIQRDHRLIASGGASPSTAFAIRISANGTLDGTFGTAGLVTLSNVSAALALDSAQRTIVAAASSLGAGMYAARLSTDDLFIGGFETQ